MTSTPRDLTAEPSAPSADPLILPQSGTGQEPSRVLVVEPHPTLRTVLVQRLRQDGHLTAAVGRASEAQELSPREFALLCSLLLLLSSHLCRSSLINGVLTAVVAQNFMRGGL